MAEPAGFWAGDGVIAGDPEPADGVVVQHEWQWRASLTPHERVMANYAMRSQAEIAEDRQRRQRSAELQQKAEDQAALVQLGLVPPPPTLADRFAQWRAQAEFEESRGREQQDAEKAALLAARADRIAELEAQLAAEQRSHARTSRRASEAVAGWGRERQRNQSSEQGYSRPRAYVRNSGGYIIGIR